MFNQHQANSNAFVLSHSCEAGDTNVCQEYVNGVAIFEISAFQNFRATVDDFFDASTKWLRPNLMIFYIFIWAT